nr:hypothetical protein [Thiohalobacter thiocyanaticus]
MAPLTAHRNTVKCIAAGGPGGDAEGAHQHPPLPSVRRHPAEICVNQVMRHLVRHRFIQVMCQVDREHPGVVADTDMIQLQAELPRRAAAQIEADLGHRRLAPEQAVAAAQVQARLLTHLLLLQGRDRNDGGNGCGNCHYPGTLHRAGWPVKRADTACRTGVL